MRGQDRRGEDTIGQDRKGQGRRVLTVSKSIVKFECRINAPDYNSPLHSIMLLRSALYLGVLPSLAKYATALLPGPKKIDPVPLFDNN